jgi:hypothetical protein
MSTCKPFRRTVRQFSDGEYSEGGRWKYILHPDYAQAPEQYIRAFFLLQEDLRRLFQFIEPADANLHTYSFRIHELLLRTCVEVEANCKAILSENGYSTSGNWTMNDYRKIQNSHLLSEYSVKFPVWEGSNNIRQPFFAWSTGSSLPWYSAYNATKHDRHNQFHQATFGHLTDSIAGMVALLAAQFWTHDFGPGSSYLVLSGHGDGMESAIGDYFHVGFPSNLPQDDRYEFDWQQLSAQSNPIQQYQYS